MNVWWRLRVTYYLWRFEPSLREAWQCSAHWWYADARSWGKSPRSAVISAYLLADE